MSPRDPDSELARLFGQLRRADEASAPAFRELLARPRARRAVPARAVWRAALTAAAGIAAAAAVVFLLRTPAEPGLPAAARELAAWKSPTDSLLRTPGAELLASLPVLAPSVEANVVIERARRTPPVTAAAPPAVPDK